MYKVVILNAGNVEIYNDIIKASNENEALKILLENETICGGDTITIDYK